MSFQSLNLSERKEILVSEPESFSLKTYDPAATFELSEKEEGKQHLKKIRKPLNELHKKLYANDNHAILMIFQAMDAAGKDSTIHKVFSGLYPQAVRVYNFKAPSEKEKDHDFLWRSGAYLPERGCISVFNRSYYEEVLVTRVHPEWIVNQRIPGLNSVDHINDDFWQKRFQSIREHESHLKRNGTVVLKFFLNVSKEEQKRRFLRRINDPARWWKYNHGDLKDRQLWDDYMHAYEQTIQHTATQDAPWYVIPADHKWFMRAAVANILYEHLDHLNLSYPEVDQTALDEMKKGKLQLESEK